MYIWLLGTTYTSSLLALAYDIFSRHLRNLLATIMCQFEYTRHSCGHTLPELEENHDPSCKLCVPFLVALQYDHDQPMHECIGNVTNSTSSAYPGRVAHFEP